MKQAAACLLLIMLAACSRNAPEQTLSAQILKNLEYISTETPDGRARLVDGTYENQPEHIAVELVSRHVVYGDVTGDRRDDALVLLQTSAGASSTFNYLALVTQQDGEPRNPAVLFLGDRIALQSVKIESGTVAVEMIKQGPDDPMCCPTLRATSVYQFKNGKFEELKP